MKVLCLTLKPITQIMQIFLSGAFKIMSSSFFKCLLTKTQDIFFQLILFRHEFEFKLKINFRRTLSFYIQILYEIVNTINNITI